MPSPDVYQTLAEKRLSSLEREFLPQEYPIRGHHVIKHIELIRALNLVSSGTGISEFINTFCSTQTEDYVSARKVINDPRLARAFRAVYGVDPNDESYPTSLPDDYVGEDPKLFTQRRMLDYIDLLTRPDSDRAVVGQFKDGVCRSCIFGKGAGGLHCGQMDFHRESLKIEDFLAFAQDYLNTLHRRRGKSAQENEIEVKETTFTPPQIWTEYDEGSLVRHTREREIHEIIMPLGLYRDVVTWKATDGKYLTYKEFVRAKNLVA